jgi:tRNA nucleotidyltransferase (CCA-adding enzyme)
MPKKKKEDVVKKVLKKIVPKKSEVKKLEGLAQKTLAMVNEQAAKHNAYAIIAGSLTRNTWLPGKTEFDIFILFPEEVPEEEMEKKGLKIGKSVIKKLGGKHTIEYAEHPYVCGHFKKEHIDIVPCFEIKSTESLKSAVDRTPFHVRYIEKKLPLELSNEVRLLKQFCTAHGVYGADTKTEGFSGYVCELLTINYGSFLAALKAASGWHAGIVIDIEKFHRKEDYDDLKKRFKDQPLILIDPTDSKRNTAAAISPQSFQTLKSAANKFFDRPSERMFFQEKKKPITLRELKNHQKQRDSDMILIKFKPPKVVPDILWPQLRRFAHRIESILRDNEFDVIRKDVYTNEKDLAVVLIELENDKLPAIRKHIGPNIFDDKGSKSFIKKYKDRAINGPFVEGEFWVIELPRKFRTAKEKLADSLSDSLKILKAKGIPSHIAAQIAKKFTLVTDVKKMSVMAKKDKGFGVFLREYFEKESLA